MKDIVTILGSTGVAAGIIYLLGYLKYKKINLPELLSCLKNAIEGLEGATDLVKNYSTGNVQKVAAMGEVIENEALKLVNGVSQKVLSGDLDKGKKATAMEGLGGYLESQGIKVSPQLNSYIDLAISDAVKKSDAQDINAKIDKLISEKVTALQKEKETIQANLNSTISENTILKTNIIVLQNKLATVQNIFDPVQNAAVEVKNTTTEQQ